MKSKILLLSLLVIGSTAFAGGQRKGVNYVGGSSGGGGKSVVCRNKDESKSIQSAQLLDLFEGEPVFDYQIAESSDPVPMQVEKRILQIAKGRSRRNSEEFLLELSSGIQKKMRVLSDKYALTETSDSLHNIELRGCEVEQLANYSDEEDILLIDGSIWRNLSPTHQAALIVHETIYKIMRSREDTDSRWARRAVGYAFADGQFEDIFGELRLAQKWYNCFISPREGAVSSFAIYNDAEGRLIAVMDTIEGKTFLSKTTVAMTGNVPWDGQDDYKSYFGLADSKLNDVMIALILDRTSPDGFELEGRVGLGMSADSPVNCRLFRRKD